MSSSDSTPESLLGSLLGSPLGSPLGTPPESLRLVEDFGRAFTEDEASDESNISLSELEDSDEDLNTIATMIHSSTWKSRTSTASTSKPCTRTGGSHSRKRKAGPENEDEKTKKLNRSINVSEGDDDLSNIASTSKPCTSTGGSRSRKRKASKQRPENEDEEANKSHRSINVSDDDDDLSNIASTSKPCTSTGVSRSRKRKASKPRPENEDEEANKSQRSINVPLDDDDLNSTASTSKSRTSTASTSKSCTSIGGRRSRKRKASQTKGYKFHSNLTEDHKTAIFGVAFYNFLAPNEDPVFATVGANRCTIYKCNDEGVELVKCYACPDPNEKFFTCTWTCRKTQDPLVIAAGKRGVIRVMNVAQQENPHNNYANFVGHGSSINQLKVHPKQLHLLLSCSKDYSIRLWNLESKTLIALFGGVDGHRADVISVDFDLAGQRLISGCMDHTLNLWDISNDDFKERIEFSNTYDTKKMEKQFPTLIKHYADFSTREVHGNYVDCVQWFGNFIISKSCQNVIVIWHIGDRRENGKHIPEIIAQYKTLNCGLCFIRFDFNIWHRMIACGNALGKIFVWELASSGPQDTHAYILSRKECNTAVRQVAFSKNAKFLVAVCDDSTVWIWMRQ